MALIYDGSGTPSRELKLAFSQGRVDAHTSRDDRGYPYYDVRAGQNAFVPEPGAKAYFAGEDVPEIKGSLNPQHVVLHDPIEVKVPIEGILPRGTSEVSVQEVTVTPLNDAAKKNEGWTPTPPKR